jgi:hypothetical protein
MRQQFLYAIFFILICGCAQLPPDTVKLSNSIRTDIKTMSDAHLAFVNYYFDNAEKQVNNFVENYYKPTYIRNEIKLDKQDAENPENQQFSVIYMLPIAFKDDADPKAQDYTLQLMGNFIKGIYDQVEKYKTSLLAPLKSQRKKLIADLNSHYAIIQNKNATITAMLSSVVEVHESQKELLKMFDVDPNLRQKVGNKLADISTTINDFSTQIDSKSDDLSKIKQQFDDLKSKLENLNEKGE